MFIVIKNDTVNLTDICRISRRGAVIKIYFISQNAPAEYYFETENDAIEVEYKIFLNLEEHSYII